MPRRKRVKMTTVKSTEATKAFIDWIGERAYASGYYLNFDGMVSPHTVQVSEMVASEVREQTCERLAKRLTRRTEFDSAASWYGFWKTLSPEQKHSVWRTDCEFRNIGGRGVVVVITRASKADGWPRFMRFKSRARFEFPPPSNFQFDQSEPQDFPESEDSPDSVDYADSEDHPNSEGYPDSVKTLVDEDAEM